MTTIQSHDQQADDFDRRAGIPEPHIARVAAAVLELGKLDTGGCLLEIGAGTGEIGAHLLAAGVDYLALERSAAMLEVFARRVDPEQHHRLRLGDANHRWPVDDGALHAVFLSRVAHLLDPHALWSEARRTAAPEGCWLLVGRRERARDSVRACLRRQMHELLADAGIEHRSGGGPRRMLGTMQEWGGGSSVRQEVVRWPVVHRPVDALDSWRGKSGLAGVEIDDEVKRRVLDRLTEWARERYGDLEQEHPSEEWYEVQGLCVPALAL
jgi:SAM-dependent methyltransferase